MDHTYSKPRAKEGSDVSEKDVLERDSLRGGHVVCSDADHDYTAKTEEYKSEKELIVDVEITVDELAGVDEVTIKEEFKAEEDASGYEEITADEALERRVQSADVFMTIIKTTTATDHNYIVRESPKTLRRRLECQLFSVEGKLQNCRKKLKVEKEKTKRLLKTVDSLTEVICGLKQKSLVPAIET